MKKKRIILGAAICALAIVSSFCLMACDGKHTGGVAATVDGHEIPEDKVTDYIESLRASYDLKSDDAWASYLAMYGMTAEQLRATVLDNFINLEAEKIAAEQKGITVSEEEISAAVDKMRANYKTDSEWQNALKSAGFDEQSYRDSVKNSLTEQKLTEKVELGAAVTDASILEGCKAFAPTFNGAKKSSHILFATGDTEKAQSVLDEINAGTLDFATAAKDNSTDTASAADGGNVGWDCLTTFVDAYQQGLADLSKDQVSGLVTSEFGIHIIKCTDVFTAPETITSPDQLPSDLLDVVKKYVESQAAATNISEWVTNFRQTLKVVINDMPAKVPYNVDTSKYINANTTDAASTTTDTHDHDNEATESK